jgi:hypothetical protein
MMGWFLLKKSVSDYSLRTTIKTYNMMRSISHRKATEWFQSLSRPERKRITEHIICTLNPGVSNMGLKVASRAGQYPKRFPTESLQRSLQTRADQGCG